MAKSKADIYANRAFAAVTMSAANTITFQQLNFAVGVFQGVALKLLRVEWHPGSSDIQEIVAAADRLTFALTLRDDLTSLDPTNQSIVCRKSIFLNRDLTAEANLFHMPIITDFTTMPEGGLLVPANPIYMAAVTAGFAGAATVRAVLYYIFVQLSDRESIELLQTIIPGNV